MTKTQKLVTAEFAHLNPRFDEPLAPLTYFKIGGPAEVLITASSVEQVQTIVKCCQTHEISLTILGGASNVIIADEGLPGIILRLQLDEVSDTGEIIANDLHLVQAGAGTKMALLVSHTVALGYTGLEYFLGIPGTLGGAVYNNGHYLSGLIGEHIHRVQVVTPNGELRWVNHQDCQFAYEQSRFQTSREVIVLVEFALQRGDKEVSQTKIREATQYRAQTQPLGIPSSGCVFQNVPNNPSLQTRFPEMRDQQFVPGGFLIDQADLKGTRIGGVEVSTKHAAWFINTGQGTARDVQALIALVKKTVKDKFGVELHEEVFYLGNN